MSNVTHHVLEWNGITISVTYDDEYLGPNKTSPNALAHLAVQSVSPERAPLPMTSTGYKSHWLHPQEVSAEGGPVGYVLAWITQEAETREWQERAAAAKQYSLF